MNARNARPLRQRLALACSELAVVALFALPSAAWAQAEPEEAPAEQSDVAETPSGPPATEDGEGTIVVTGSRLVTGFQSPNPLTVLGEEEIQQRAPQTLGEVFNQIPSFRPTNSPSTAGVTSRGGGHQISPDLRGLGDVRTLVLVNGRRFVPTTASGTVDTKLIPTLLVRQIEVVTGGASAAYGSDAVAGVVNFLLKERVEGIQGTLQTGISQRGDGSEIRASLATGFTFDDDRGRFMIGADYLRLGAIGTQLTRGWGRREVGLITNPNFATNGLPQFIIAENVHSANTTPGGLIVSGPLRGLAFGPNGSTYQYQFGQVFGSSMIGGSGQYDNENLLATLGVPIEALNTLARISYDVSDNLEIYTELSASWSNAGGFTQESRDRGNLVIQRDNAFLPESVRQAMLDNNLQTITIGRVLTDVGKIELDRDTRVLRGVIGAEGDLGGGWTWDAYYQYGRTDFDLIMGPNNRRQAEYRNAVDAVVDPGSGDIVCRSTLTDPTNGCIPVNVFGYGSLQLNDYVFGSAVFNQLTDQHAAAANIQGSPFSTWAGPVSIGFGAEYRRDRTIGVSDPVSQQLNPNGSTGGWILGNQLPFEGRISVWELYAETLVPLAEDLPFAHELNVTGAVRRTHYSTSGTVYTWKGGVTWSPIEDIRFRLTRSRDIRAPNITELYESGGSSNTNVFDPVLGQSIQVRELNDGNPDLRPEIANTLALGVVLQPRFLPRFAFSVDYYDIKIDDVITTLGAPTLAQGCFAGNTLYCDSIVFNNDGSIAYVVNTRLNLASFKTSGIDFEMRYSFRPSFLPGNIQLRALATYVDTLTLITPAGARETVGQVSEVNRTPGVPHWTGNADISYSDDHLTLGVQGRLIGSGVFSNLYTTGAGEANTVSRNEVPAYAYFNLYGSFNVPIGNDRQVQFFGTINNILDQDPPFLPSGAAGGTRETSTNPVFYDVIGRYFRFGVRFRI
jgi:outer membrane receptor protein involved in Fe transport